MRSVAWCSLLMHPCPAKMAHVSMRCSLKTSCRRLLPAAAHCYLACVSLLRAVSSLGSAAATFACLLLALSETSCHA